MTEGAGLTHHEKTEGVVNGAVGKAPAPEKASPADDNVEGDEGAVNGGELEERGDEVDYEEERQIVGDEDDDDEDDEYEVEEEEEGGGAYELEPEGEDEEEGVQDHRGTNTLTHLLLGNPNAPAGGDDLDDLDDEADEEEEDDDDDDDDDYVEHPEPPVAAVEAPEPISRKRSIQEVVDDADDAEPQGSKKVRA